MAKADLERYRKLLSAKNEAKARRTRAIGYAQLKVKNGDDPAKDIAEAESAGEDMKAKEADRNAFVREYVGAHEGEFVKFKGSSLDALMTLLDGARRGQQKDMATQIEMWIAYRFTGNAVEGTIAAIKQAATFGKGK